MQVGIFEYLSRFRFEECSGERYHMSAPPFAGKKNLSRELGVVDSCSG